MLQTLCSTLGPAAFGDRTTLSSLPLRNLPCSTTSHATLIVAVGRAEIAEHVWDEAFDPFSNLIEVYIQRLRRKIDEGHSLKLIRTLRGQGYMLCSGEPQGHV